MNAFFRSLLKSPFIAGAALLGPHRHTKHNDNALWVLMYHRVMPDEDPRFAAEEPGMVVTPATLDLQLSIAKKHFTLISLDEWISRRDRGQPLPARACAITFDDGWLDNYEFAFPILQKHQVPATIFVVADMLGTAKRFWPNRLADLLNRTEEAHSAGALNWLNEILPAAPRSAPDREQLAQIVAACKGRSDAWVSIQLDEAEQRMGGPAIAPAHSLMDWHQLEQMVASGLITAGSHTCNHYRLLPTLDAETMEKEIVESKRLIQERLGKAVSLFCYPNGDADPRALQLVRETYSAAVTTQRGINNVGTDSCQLARIGLHEDGSSTPLRFQARLSGWI